MSAARTLVVLLLVALAGCGAAGGVNKQISRAESLLQTGDYGEALITLRNALQDAPDNARAQTLIVRLHLQRNEADAARAALESVAKLGVAPDELAALRARLMLLEGDYAGLLVRLEAEPDVLPAAQRQALRGRALQGLGRIPEALEIFEGLQKQSPDSEELGLRIAECHAAFGRAALARKQIEQTLQAHPQSAEAWLQRATLDRHADDVKAALEASNNAMRYAGGALSASQQAVLYTQLIESALQLGDLPTAANAHAQLIKRLPGSPLIELLEARMLFAGGKVPEAIAQLQTQIVESPQNAAARQSLFAAQLTAGRVEQTLISLPDLPPAALRGRSAKSLRDAIEAINAQPETSVERAAAVAGLQLALGEIFAARVTLEQALPANKDAMPLQVALVLVDSRAGRHAEAQSRAQTLLKLHPEDRNARAALAEAQLAAGHAADAITHYEALRAQAFNGALALALSRARQQAGRPDAAEPLQSWVSSHADDQAARALLAELLFQRGSFDAATSEYAALARQTPPSAHILSRLAELGFATDSAPASGFALRAIQLDPTLPEALAAQGLALTKSGDLAYAVGLLSRAVTADPANPRFRSYLAAALAKAGQTGDARRWLADALRDQAPFPGRAAAEGLLQSLLART